MSFDTRLGERVFSAGSSWRQRSFLSAHRHIDFFAEMVRAGESLAQRLSGEEIEEVQMALRRRFSKQQSVLGKAISAVVEPLETRQLLTTLTTTLSSTMTYDFQQQAGDAAGLIRIGVGKNTVAEIVGAVADDQNNAAFGPLPGVVTNTVTDPTTGVGTTEVTQIGAGVGGARGTTFIGGYGATDMRAIAVGTVGASNGVTYGLDVNVVNVTSGTTTIKVPIVNLVRFDVTADGAFASSPVVIANLAPAIITAPGNPMDFGSGTTTTAAEQVIDNVSAAAFMPDSATIDATLRGRLFFVASGGKSKIPVLFSVDVNAADATAIQNSLILYAGAFGSSGATNGLKAEVRSILFDTNPNAVDPSDGSSPGFDLLVYGNWRTGNGTTQSSTFGLYNTSLLNTNVSANRTIVGDVTNGKDTVEDIYGISLQNDDPLAADTYLYAIRHNGSARGKGAEMMKIRRFSTDSLGNRTGASLGFTWANLQFTTTTPNQKDFLGDNLNQFAFSTTVRDTTLDTDPTGAINGTFIAFDNTLNSLVRVTTTLHPGSMNVYTIYVSQSNSGSYLTIGSIARASNNDPLNTKDDTLPFAGSAGSFNVNNYDTKTAGKTPVVSISAPGGSGEALLGTRSLDLEFDDKDNQNKNPNGNFTVLRGQWDQIDTQGFGVIPAGTDMLPNDPTANLAPGIFIADGQNFGNINIGGTFTGTLRATGSVKTFYAGLMLGGDGRGLAAGATSSTASADLAINVGGELRNIWVQTNAGTNPTSTGSYNTGLVANIGGRVQQIKVLGQNAVQWHVQNLPTAPSLTIPGAGAPSTNSNLLTELESFNGLTDIDTGDVVETGLFRQGFLPAGNPAVGGNFRNDTLETAQYLGAVIDSTAPANNNYFVALDGMIDGGANLTNSDNNDVYAIGLMAGQAVDIQMFETSATATGELNFGVYDPDGRLIQTDISEHHASALAQHTLHIVADRPGAYKIAVGVNGDGDMIHGGEFNPLILGVVSTYRILVTNVGNIALGGLLLANDLNQPVTVDQGDVGAIQAGGKMYSSQGLSVINILGGDVRDIETPLIGNNTTAVSSAIMNFSGGNVGLIRTTGFGLILSMVAPVGGTTQEMDVSGVLDMIYSGNGGIGTIKVRGDFGLTGFINTTSIRLNVDGIGDDGKVDLIDVGGNFNGPSLSTGPGGDIGFIRVAGTVTRDPFFGTATVGEVETHEPGASVDYTDDSGATYTITPTGTFVDNPLYGTAGAPVGTTRQFGPALTLIPYGIEDKGGVVLIKATVSNVLGVDANGTASSGGGISITSTGDSKSSAVIGIGELNVLASGNPVTRDITTNLLVLTDTTTGTAATPVNVTLGGSTPISILNLIAAGNLDAISQTSGGAILGLSATSVGTLTSNGPIGVDTVHRNPGVILPQTVASDVYPFSKQGYLISVPTIYAISTTRAIGNISASLGIGSLTANSDGTHTLGQFDGINAPIVTSYLQSADIGEGILPTGSGNVAFAGIYASHIDSITSSTSGAVIRGNIILSSGGAVTIAGTTLGINSISLEGGSIIDANIEVIGNPFSASREINRGLLTLPTVGVSETPTYGIGTIQLTGNGGIIGTYIAAYSINSIDVSGFGILTTGIFQVSDGTLNHISAGGYGFRNFEYFGGGTINEILAPNNSNSIPTSTYSRAVRQSEIGDSDPYFGFTPNALSDLHANLGTSSVVTEIDHVTDGGVIENSQFAVANKIGTIQAHRIRVSNRSAVPVVGGGFTDPTSPTTTVSGTFFTAANKIGSISVSDTTDGLQVTTGRIGSFFPGHGATRTGISIAGPINSMKIAGDFGRLYNDPATNTQLPDSYIQASGPNGSIGNLRVTGNLIGSVLAVKRIGTIRVDGNIAGNITSSGFVSSGTALGKLIVGGTLSGGVLKINGSVGTIEALGSFGAAGDTLEITGSLHSLRVGTSSKISGSELALNLTVGSNLYSLYVQGRVTGSITVAKSLTTATIVSDGAFDRTTTALVTGAIHAGKIGTLVLRNGSLGASVTADVNLATMKVIGGNVDAGVTISSAVGSIFSLQVLANKGFGGNVYGSITENASVRSNITIAGDFGNQIDAASIQGRAINLLKIGGSVLGNTSIAAALKIGTFQATNIGDTDANDGVLTTTVTAPAFSVVKIKGLVRNGTTITSTGVIKSLTILGTPVSVEAGAAISATKITKRNIKGTVDGTITTAI